jgi:hypothetical protein
MSYRPARLLLATLAVPNLLAAGSAQSAQSGRPGADPGFQDVYWDTLDDQGRLTGGVARMFVPPLRDARARIPAPVTTLTQSLLPQNPANRLDLVVVGDGYQIGQLGTYASHVQNITASFFDKEPYLTYRPLFLVHRVDVVSVDSGVDNDPTLGVQKNTAMDMGFYCDGVDRLLCVDVALARQYANNAPDVDLVLAIANSSTYGGAGYPASDLATAAAANGAALEIVRHEFGHAIGGLADEYEYGGPATYLGPEPQARNISKLDSAAMLAAMAKWYRWLGANFPAFDGAISTYEGGGQSQFGVYRPTFNSLMRNLNRPFNLPSAEKLILEIYRVVDPIDDSSPTAPIYDGTETLFVTPVAPQGNPLAIQWAKDGVAIPGATGTSLALPSLGLGSCPVTVTVTVRDTTTMVRDEDARTQLMTETRSFSVQPGGSGFENTCVTTPNSAGAGAVMSWQGSNSVSANDILLQTFGCPPNKTGLYFMGTAEAQIVLGNGFRCIASPIRRFHAIQTNLFGDAEMPLDLANLPGGDVVGSGDVRYFQLWFRDPPGGGASTDLSDALRVRFCP